MQALSISEFVDKISQVPAVQEMVQKPVEALPSQVKVEAQDIEMKEEPSALPAQAADFVEPEAPTSNNQTAFEAIKP